MHPQVIMGDRPAAERACKDPNPIIDGRKANVNLAILGAKPRGNLPTGEFFFLSIFLQYTLPTYLLSFSASFTANSSFCH